MATTENEPINSRVCVYCARVCVYCGNTKAAPICAACCEDGHLESAELARLRAEVEELEGRLADERRAVERLAGLADDCPPNWSCNWGRDDESCAMCRAAWARQKEVG